MFFRFVMPFIVFVVTLFYLFVITHLQLVAADEGRRPPSPARCSAITCPTCSSPTSSPRRQQSIMRAFPDALDLMLICVESGMSIESAFTRVAAEIGTQSAELAEELALTTAELSYLPDRRQAFDNLAKRCGHSGVKAVATALNQAEKYGTPMGQALRVTATENREMRMQEAERKAASLPAKLTVPMIIFFLPCLFVVIMGPAIINITHMMHEPARIFCVLSASLVAHGLFAHIAPRCPLLSPQNLSRWPSRFSMERRELGRAARQPAPPLSSRCRQSAGPPLARPILSLSPRFAMRRSSAGVCSPATGVPGTRYLPLARFPTSTGSNPASRINRLARSIALASSPAMGTPTRSPD